MSDVAYFEKQLYKATLLVMDTEGWVQVNIHLGKDKEHLYDAAPGNVKIISAHTVCKELDYGPKNGEINVYFDSRL